MRSTHRGIAAPLFQFSLVAVVLGAGLYFDRAAQHAQEPSTLADAVQLALERDEASDQVRAFTRWVMSSGDHGNMPFIVVDTSHARIYAFGPLGQLRGSAPLLPATARADDPTLRPTPAGRFTSMGRGAPGAATLAWSQGNIELSLHPTPPAITPGAGLQRPAASGSDDRSMPEGSLNVAAGFYREHLEPLRALPSVAYVLPEAGTAQALIRPTRPQAMQRDTRLVAWQTRRLS